MDSSRRQLCLGIAAVFGTTLGYPILDAHAAGKRTPKERVIRIQAKRFAYTPSEIVVRKGERVILEFTSLDFVHGFNIPDMNIRADLPPGQVTRVHLNPEKSGTYDFLCDNFCGSGHEEMNGKLIVRD